MPILVTERHRKFLINALKIIAVGNHFCIVNVIDTDYFNIVYLLFFYFIYF